MSKILIAYDLVGPNGYIPYTYDKDTISSVMEKELREVHNRDYFHNIEKVSTHQLIHQLKYNDSYTYLIPLDNDLRETPLERILTPDFFNFIKDKENFHIIYVSHYEESKMHPLI